MTFTIIDFLFLCWFSFTCDSTTAFWGWAFEVARNSGPIAIIATNKQNIP